MTREPMRNVVVVPDVEARRGPARGCAAPSPRVVQSERLGFHMADQKVTKAVIPAAGLGTRFLPATKATPKEMLPVVDKPAIQYVVEEAVAAGLDDILMITGRGKSALEDHFDRNYELEARAAGQGRRRAAGARASGDRSRERALRAPGRPQRSRPCRPVRRATRRARAVRRPAR